MLPHDLQLIDKQIAKLFKERSEIAELYLVDINKRIGEVEVKVVDCDQQVEIIKTQITELENKRKTIFDLRSNLQKEISDLKGQKCPLVGHEYELDQHDYEYYCKYCRHQEW